MFFVDDEVVLLMDPPESRTDSTITGDGNGDKIPGLQRYEVPYAIPEDAGGSK
jgi:hypothetical protein